MPAYKDPERGTWFASFYYTDWQGHRKLKKKRGFARKKDAEQYEREFLHKEAGTCDMSFGSLVELYLADMKNRLRASTMQSKRHIIETKILPTFSSRKVNEITPAMVRRWQAQTLAQGYAQTYAKSIHNQLSAIFNYACRYYGLKENPARTAGSMGKKQARSMRFWLPEDFNAFLPYVDKYPARVGFEVLFWTGMRIGELLALTPEDIDLEKGTISVSKSFQVIDGDPVISEAKTEKSRRVISIPKKLVQTLKEYEAAFYGLQPADRLWPFTKSYFQQQMKKACEEGQIERIRLHDLRHSHASFLIRMKVPILLISERLGHENVQTTLQTYGHLYPAETTEAVEKMDDLIPGKSEEVMPK